MTDDEQIKEPQDEAPDTSAEDAVEETTQDQGESPAGPVAAGDPPPPAVAEASSGAVPPATPPAGEESGSDEAPAEEEEAGESEAAAEEPAAEEEAPAEKAKAAEPEPEPNPEDELPWKERLRLQKSRQSRKARPQLSPEERLAQRREARKAKASLRRKQRAATRGAKVEAGAGTPPAERAANAAKVRQGVVVSDKGEKSITVRIDIVRRHPTYEKVVRRSRTLHAHDERNEASEGDVVRVVETRPLSKTKRWRLVEVLEKAK